MQPEQELINERLKKLEDIKKLGINPYPYTFEKTHDTIAILDRFKKLKKEEKTKNKVSVAGRIVSLRRMGKASFAHLQDASGKIQFYIKEDDIGSTQYELFKKFDIGDIVGIHGTVFRTKMGEITIHCTQMTLLTKSIRPLPEKWHGLKDVEARYRNRHLDLISNPETKIIFIKRAQIVSSMRAFLDTKGFLEVETPVLQKIYGGANARPFKSFLHDLKMDVYLRISDELYLKRLIVGGFEKVYEISKDFRNESIDRTHNPEFTLMEAYAAYWDYEDVMKLTEQMVAFIAKQVNGTTKCVFKGKTINLQPPWQRLSMIDAIKKYAKINVTKLSDAEIQATLRNYNIEYEGDYTRGIAIQLLFEELCEDKLVGPVFIIDHPKETTMLCKTKRGNPQLIERFEPYVAGMEIGNAYSELNDPLLQRQLLEEQARQLRAGSEEAHPMDEEFVQTLEVGMPPTGGVGISVDRITMILTGQESIRDVVFFPFMKDTSPK